MPYIWVQGVTAERIKTAFTSHPAILDLTIVESFSGNHLLRVEWRATEPTILQTLLASNVTLLSAEGTATEWRFEIRAEEQTHLADFERRCNEAGFSVELTRLQSGVADGFSPPTELTEKQREALNIAYRRGYFNTPREATLEDIAEELGISRQALASRLRRGLFHVVGAMFGNIDGES